MNRCKKCPIGTLGETRMRNEATNRERTIEDLFETDVSRASVDIKTIKSSDIKVTWSASL